MQCHELPPCLSAIILTTYSFAPDCRHDPVPFYPSFRHCLPAHRLRHASGGGGRRTRTPPSLEPETPPPLAQPANFAEWQQAFTQRAAAGIADNDIQQLLARTHYEEKVVSADRKQPELNKMVWAYLDNAVSNDRIQKGCAQLARYRSLLQQIEAQTGVGASYIVAFWGMVRPAKDKHEQSDWLMLELEKDKSPGQRAELYQPIAGHWQDFAKEILPLSDLGKHNPQAAVDEILRQYPQADGFLPMMGGDWDMTVLVSNKEQKILATVDLRPW